MKGDSLPCPGAELCGEETEFTIDGEVGGGDVTEVGGGDGAKWKSNWDTMTCGMIVFGGKRPTQSRREEVRVDKEPMVCEFSVHVCLDVTVSDLCCKRKDRAAVFKVVTSRHQ